jgi:hypothetical protein
VIDGPELLVVVVVVVVVVGVVVVVVVVGVVVVGVVVVGVVVGVVVVVVVVGVVVVVVDGEVEDGVTLAQSCATVSSFAWAAAVSCVNAWELSVTPFGFDAEYEMHRATTLVGMIDGPRLLVVVVVVVVGDGRPLELVAGGVMGRAEVPEAWLLGLGMDTPTLDRPCDSGACRGAGREPVAAAAAPPPTTRAVAPARTLADMNFPRT